jgi:hypothetical protein
MVSPYDVILSQGRQIVNACGSDAGSTILHNLVKNHPK